MTSQELVQHLLDVEEKAGGIVQDAQAEADKRVMEASRTIRANHQALLARHFADLDAAYQAAITASRAGYDKQLDDYRQSLAALPVHADGFSALAARYFALPAAVASNGAAAGVKAGGAS
jgi:FMN phosphatase YigB (HAD superfamily)